MQRTMKPESVSLLIASVSVRVSNMVPVYEGLWALRSTPLVEEQTLSAARELFNIPKGSIHTGDVRGLEIVRKVLNMR
jgi:hypothetical protein